jgi:cytoplasmic iron level regulating protein YaaA (DUF328/UPF0246 family)
VLVLLPPSEGKTAPLRGRPLDLATLSFPSLTATRMVLLDHLVDLAGRDPELARKVLGVSPRQTDEVARDAALRTAACAPAGEIYSGVLYDALGLASLPTAAQRRAHSALILSSALFGALRIADAIPPYRLSGDVSLPGLGTVAGLWREPLADAMNEAASKGLIVDLRSTTYAALWRPAPDIAHRTLSVRVLQQLPDGSRKIISHFNKATKGRLVRSLLLAGTKPRNAEAFAGACELLGYTVELADISATTTPRRLDVIVTEV